MCFYFLLFPSISFYFPLFPFTSINSLLFPFISYLLLPFISFAFVSFPFIRVLLCSVFPFLIYNPQPLSPEFIILGVETHFWPHVVYKRFDRGSDFRLDLELIILEGSINPRLGLSRPELRHRGSKTLFC